MKTATAKTRIQFSNILFATDFSPAAARAIPYVKAIAKHYDARVVALHVAAPMVNPTTQPASWPAVLEAENARRQERQKELRANAESLGERIYQEKRGIWRGACGGSGQGGTPNQEPREI